MITFGSLFAGIGGFDLGFERSGMVCKWQVEIDDYANKVLEKHWPGVHRERDIRSCGSHNLERVDVICGGFPCQDISYAGLGAGLDGERSGLFYEAIRVVRELQPKVVVLENVAALLTRGLDRVLGTLASIGFDAEWHCIPAAYVGAPHIRDRIFILGYSNGGRRESRFKTWKKPRHGISVSTTSAYAKSMANSTSNGREARGNFSNEVSHTEMQQWESKPSGKGFTPNSNCEGLEKWQGKDSGGARAKCWTEFGGSQWWESEPNVGRVAHGVSFGLERFGGLRDGNEGGNTETLAEGSFLAWEVLCEVWKQRELAASSPDIFVERLRHLVPDMSCAIGLRKWVKKASEDKELCDMWSRVQSLPFEETQDMQQRMLERARTEECSQAMGLKKSRVDRLRGLGNAIVPQVAEWIGRQIVGALQ